MPQYVGGGSTPPDFRQLADFFGQYGPRAILAFQQILLGLKELSLLGLNLTIVYAPYIPQQFPEALYAWSNGQIVTAIANDAAQEADLIGKGYSKHHPPPPPPSSSILFPGQSGNPVGFASSPGYVGDTAGSGLTPTAGSIIINVGGTPGNPIIYNHVDFTSDGVNNHGTVFVGADWITFTGCRFQSNDIPNYNVQVQAKNIVFSYCTFVPLRSLVPSPPNDAWPGAGAGLNITQTGDGSADYPNFVTPLDNGYQYGLDISTGSGFITVDHCEFWGFGEAITIETTTGEQVTITDCWIHSSADSRNSILYPAIPNYHTDGIGYLNGGAPPTNVIIRHCTIASIGNTNGIAFQNATSPYSGITVDNCYLTGFGNLVDMCHNVVGNSSLTFTNNIFGTDIPWTTQPIYTDFSAQFTGTTNKWRGNILRVRSGTFPTTGSGFAFTSADDGKYMWPNGTLHAADFGG